MQRSLVALSLVALSYLAVACLSPFTSDGAAERIVDEAFDGVGRERGGHVVLTTGTFAPSWRQFRYAAEPGPEPLVAAADRLAACGQELDDPLEARISIRGSWPWEVRILQATPGAERCLEGVLSQLPLDADMAGGRRYVAVRTTVGDLWGARRQTTQPLACSMRRVVKETPYVAAEHHHAPLGDAGDIAARVTCPAATPRTELTVRYDDGALVEARTSPPVPCVEDGARAALAHVSELFADGGPPRGADPWDEVTCTVLVPLRGQG